MQFAPSESYPGYERELLTFSDENADECYSEFCISVRPDIQSGGYPSCIQSDFMERDCVNAFGIGDVDDWILLLQLFEIGNMSLGDAGALDWLIHRDDLKTMRFDSV